MVAVKKRNGEGEKEEEKDEEAEKDIHVTQTLKPHNTQYLSVSHG